MNCSLPKKLRTGPLIALGAFDDFNLPFVECREREVGFLCADVEQFRASEVDDVLKERSRHCGEFLSNGDKHLLVELTAVIFYWLRSTRISSRRHSK
jgi:hypothetical protein